MAVGFITKLKTNVKYICQTCTPPVNTIAITEMVNMDVNNSDPALQKFLKEEKDIAKLFKETDGVPISKIFNTQQNVDNYLKQFEGSEIFKDDKNIVFSSKPAAAEGGELINKGQCIWF